MYINDLGALTAAPVGAAARPCGLPLATARQQHRAPGVRQSAAEFLLRKPGDRHVLENVCRDAAEAHRQLKASEPFAGLTFGDKLRPPLNPALSVSAAARRSARACLPAPILLAAGKRKVAQPRAMGLAVGRSNNGGESGQEEALNRCLPAAGAHP